MDILVNVVNQKLKIATNLKTFVEGTQEFIRFIFNLANDWDDLTVFAQFGQDGKTYNAYLDKDNSAYLPSEIKAGSCTLMLYGTLGKTRATTNYLVLNIDENILVNNASSTEISTSLYDQLVNRVDTLENNLGSSEAISGVITREVEEELAKFLANGSLANMTIVDGSITKSKLNAGVVSSLGKADTAMQPSVYDTKNRQTDVFTYVDVREQSLKGDVAKITNEIADAYQITPTITHNNLGDAVRGVIDVAKNYTDAKLSTFNAFDIVVVDKLPETGEELTFYLVPNTTGDKYDKYWWITGKDGRQAWDAFGSASTIIVNELPEIGEEDVDYILKTAEGCMYYKWIDGEWNIVAGSLANIVERLPENGNSFTDYYIANENDTYSHYRYINGEFKLIGNVTYTKSEVDDIASSLQTKINVNTQNIATNAENLSSLNNALTNLQQEVKNIDTEGYTYYATYGTAVLMTGEESDNVYTLWEVKDNVETIKSQFVIAGGGGNGTPATNLVVDRITASPIVITPTDKVEIKINFSSTDSDGEAVDATYTWKMGNSVLSTGVLIQGENTFDLTDFVSVGTQKLTLTVVDEGGSVSVKTWTVQVIDVRIESNFNDKITYPAGSPVSFSFTPYGSIPKTVHFILDGEELDSVITSASGTLQSYSLPSQEHGAHLLECYMTAKVNNEDIETDHIFKDIIWYDDTSDIPVIGCSYRYDYYGAVESRQYNTTNITYYVFDPNTSTPIVTHTHNDILIATETLPAATSVNTWTFKTDEIGEHVLIIACGETSVTIKINVAEIGIDVSPITANLAFDFNPTGYSNGSDNRLWRDEKTGVKMTVSDNFDWSNGGYQLDADGNQYFCVKAGTTATIDYKLFERDASVFGSEFKVVFKTTNVRDVNATFLSCMAGETPVGLQMDAHAAYLRTSATGDSPLYIPYSEEDIVEIEFNINTIDTENEDATAVIATYEDGVGLRPMLYDSNHRLYQYANDAAPITIGSADCDVHIYRIKAYSSSLSDSDILSNFIADARTSEDMLDRYYRNQIYNENNDLTPESVALACPDLKIIKIDCPYFTQDKKEMIKNTTIECIHTNGDKVLDNWKAVNCYHSGQGTTSNEYGYAGRNLNLYMCFDGNYTNKNCTYDPDYITELTMGDGTKYADGTGKVTLTRNSIPNALFNIKVNIASSENANNALLQKRFHQFLPYTTVAQKRNSNTKTTMEFANCVVFVRENNTDVSTHREFQDTNWHFYAIGNIGDSKDTDQTRANDPTDHNEFVIEISDNTKPNSIFPTGVTGEDGKMVYPIDKSQWIAGNTAYDSLYSNWDETFEFRYEHPDITDEEQSNNIQIWNDFYEWIITSADEEFISGLKDWMIEDSALYMYLFTERYTMTDNRAKNTFWHYSKVYISQDEATALGEEIAKLYTIDDDAASIRNGYRFDFWDYDNDTALGINNSGEMTMPYGKEDTDYRIDGDPNSGYIFNAAESVFFCRIRDLMYSKLQTMYLSRETAGAWNSESLIKEFDAWQEMFPEELWRLDIQRKYYRTYEGGTKRFLETMMNGRKKYHRRQWERDQDPYMGSKYVSASVKADQIMFRCNTPQSAVVTPNYDLLIIPYADMYINVLYGNSANPIRVRAKAGQEYKIINPLSTAMDDTAILIYECSRIQALNDISGCYIHDNDFSKASKLQKLIIGNSTEGYSNTFLTELNIGNNALLQELNVRNCPNLIGSVNLTNCGNLEKFYAEGTAITGVLFAPNGKIATAYLPNTVNSLTMRNLNYLTDLQMSYDNLESLTIENSIIDNYAIVLDAADTLQTLRLTGVDWILPDTNLLNQILSMNSSLLVGKAYISGAVRNQELLNYENAWNDLIVTYEPTNLVTQYLVTFVNSDDDKTVLYEVYVDRGLAPPDPVSNGWIATPTKNSTAQYDFEYTGWDDIESSVLTNKTITAKYSEKLRKYTVNWYSRAGLSLGSKEAYYGEEVVYPGGIPTRTDEENAYIYNVFKGWDKSTGFIKEDTNVYAIWDRTELPALDTDMSDMTLAQIYGISAAGMADTYLQMKDYIDIKLGHDFDFSNVKSEVLAENLHLDGKTAKNTGIQLFGQNEKTFTIAIDFQFASNKSGGTLLSCFEEDGSEGFRLRYANNPNIQWGNTNQDVGCGNMRDIVVIRHVQGDNKLYVYSSNGDSPTSFSDAVVRIELNRNRNTSTDAKLVLGAVQFLGDGGYDYYGDGMIHWCKIWYDDLGDANAQKLAAWYHEPLRVEFSGSNRYRLAGNTSQRANVSIVANNLLSCRGYAMNSTNTNTGGWRDSKIHTFCNTRLIDALPIELQSIIKSVKVATSAGDKSEEVLISEDKIYLLCNTEITNNASNPYVDEGEHIAWFTSDALRAKFKGRIIPDDATYYSANADPSSISTNFVKEGDIWVTGTKVCCIYVSQEELDKYNITPTYTASIGGGWIMADNWWLRSPNVNYSSYFMIINSNGSANLNSANASAGVCIGFSI